MMNCKEIEYKIEELEKELLNQNINLVTAEGYLALLQIHNELWNLLIFKKFQEKTFLKDYKKEEIDKNIHKDIKK